MREEFNKTEVGARLREVREKSLKLTQADLAKVLGCSPSSISNAERGNELPSPQLLVTLLRIYNVSIDWLLTGKGGMYVSPISYEDLKRIADLFLVFADCRVHRFASFIKESPEEKVDAVIEIIRNLENPKKEVEPETQEPSSQD